MKKVLFLLALTLTIGAIPQSYGNDRDDKSDKIVSIGTNHFSPLMRFDLNGDGTVTSNEFYTVSQNRVSNLQSNLLAKYDANHDGSISSNEARTVHETIAEAWLTNILHRFDHNGDGIISSNDFSGIERDDHHRPFGVLDANKDKVVSADELVAAAESIANNMQKRLFAKFDSNKDGVITSNESNAVFQAGETEEIAEVLARFDLNKDGDVTGAEVSAVLQARVHRRGGSRH